MSVQMGSGPNEGVDPGALLRDGGIGDPAFTLTWSHDRPDEGPDIDIWVISPNGQLVSTSRDGYGLGPSPDGGQIDHDDLGARGDGDGGGPERAFWPQDRAPRGIYTYGVNYYGGTGSVRYTLRVYKAGALVASETGTLEENDGRRELGKIEN